MSILYIKPERRLCLTKQDGSYYFHHTKAAAVAQKKTDGYVWSNSFLSACGYGFDRLVKNWQLDLAEATPTMVKIKVTGRDGKGPRLYLRLTGGGYELGTGKKGVHFDRLLTVDAEDWEKYTGTKLRTMFEPVLIRITVGKV